MFSYYIIFNRSKWYYPWCAIIFLRNYLGPNRAHVEPQSSVPNQILGRFMMVDTTPRIHSDAPSLSGFYCKMRLWHFHGWPSTQPNRFAHNLAAHHRAAHNPAGRWCAGSVVCNLPRQHCRLAQRWPNIGTIVPTLGQHWANLHCCLTRIMRVMHTTEPAHHRAARLCAARWCAARLCVIRLGCVEGHPWFW